MPTIGAEFEKLAREATASNQTFEQYLLRLTELEVATRQSNALTARIRQADFPVEKDLESFDFSTSGAVNKQKVLELARCGPPCGRCPIARRSNVCLLGQPGTGWSYRHMLRLLRRVIIRGTINETSLTKHELRQFIDQMETYLYLAA